MAEGVANKEQAEKCLVIAREALAAGNIEKASRFGEKSMKLYPHDEARKVMRAVRSKTATPSASSANAGDAASSSGQTPAANGGLRQRPPAAAPQKDPSTPEQRELVRSILAKRKDFYQVLSIQKGAGEDEIKKAYRKLALKLHPDKNKAAGADEAFKVVSRAFSCLSDSDKRAAYDRYGEEAPGLTRTRSAQEFDPNEIFNAFFGGGFGGGGFQGAAAPMFRAHFGQPGGHGQSSHQQQNPLASLVAVLPILALFMFMFFSGPSEPVFTLDRTSTHLQELATSRMQIPFFVKSTAEFDQKYPTASAYRLKLDREVEAAYEERLSRLCYNERVAQHHQMAWGNVKKARAMELQYCKEYDERFGARQYQQQRAFAF